MMRWLLLIFALLATPVAAVEPDEILSDPALEARARVISKELRCLKCRNENIDSSNADIARDLRLLVRERLLEGDTNDQVLDFVVERYGPYVLLKPPFSWANALLWLTGPILLLIGALMGLRFVRRQPVTVAADGLNAAEQARLDELTKS